MGSEYLRKYDDFIDAYEKLFCLNSSDSAENMTDLISSVLITKYNTSFNKLIMNIFRAIQYNYRSIDLYVQILNQISAKFSKDIIKILARNDLFSMCHRLNIYPCSSENSNQVRYNNQNYPKENEILYIIMHDQIDKFKEYITNNSLENETFNIPTYYYVSPIEACCYFGSVNIFYFLISNSREDINPNYNCLEFALMGRNTDIINECMKNTKLNSSMLDLIVMSHNNQFLEHIIMRDLCNLYELKPRKIVKSQNLKAVFLMFEKEKNSVIPWCAAFPQSIDILKEPDLCWDSISYKERNIMHFATKSNSIELCKFILNLKVLDSDYLSSLDRSKMTPVHYAVKNKNKEMIELLISNGASPDAISFPERNPLQYAVYNSLHDMIEVLISNGAKINAKFGPDDMAALHQAVEMLIELLVSHGADVNVKDERHNTPLHISSQHHESIKIAEFLISNGADVNARDQEQRTPLYFATRYNFIELVKLLISHGTEISAIDFTGATALHIAARSHNNEIAKLLILNGADVNIKDNSGSVPLCLAINANNSEISELLILHDANIGCPKVRLAQRSI
ncbi:hypothetical protein TVAG_150790 [Trichomonas vaginalis G3]|uniref:DUF3447 domain-containing protein n=1 Tax=Trichomonas vaginalis (strain ATCC PRA-98 / G3) TaxID=412133 RepID=A2DRY0_TRIV3|nr:hypothetical protein TVAG_150790 [Trichomonas vaginalis G3]|eukprot:XP_001329150.1 hypothetical protein [Trichomonas vaginalis G3]